MLTVPALKVQQFSQEFYLLNLAAADVDRLVRFEVLGDAPVHGKQSRRKASATTPPVGIHWSEIEHRVQTSEKAFQRPILRRKVEELAQYYLQCREDGALPAIPGAILLVSDGPICFNTQGGNPFVGLMQLPEQEGSLRVLDGQHRLLALAALLHEPQLAVEGPQLAHLLQVPAILFVGLPPPNVVEMFVTINSKHTRLNPSLLVSLAGRKLFGDPREALVHDIARVLNETEGSPLQGHIKMLGVGSGRVQQATLAQQLRNTLADLEQRDAALHAELVDHGPRFFLTYFEEIARSFGTAWASKKHSTRSGIALRAFIQVAPDVLLLAKRTGDKLRPALRRVLGPWATRIGTDRFETTAGWRAKIAGGGTETTRLLARELLLALEPSKEQR